MKLVLPLCYTHWLPLIYDLAFYLSDDRHFFAWGKCGKLKVVFYMDRSYCYHFAAYYIYDRKSMRRGLLFKVDQITKGVIFCVQNSFRKVNWIFDTLLSSNAFKLEIRDSEKSFWPNNLCVLNPPEWRN